MSDLLSNLVTRSLGTAPVIQPRLPTLFEPAKPYNGSFGDASDPGEDEVREAESAVENAKRQSAAQQDRQAPVSRPPAEERVNPESPPPIPQASRSEKQKNEPAVRTSGHTPALATYEGPRESRPTVRKPAVRTPGQKTSARLSQPFAEAPEEARTSARASVAPAFEKNVPAGALTASAFLPKSSTFAPTQDEPQHPDERSEAAVPTPLGSTPKRPDAPSQLQQSAESQAKPPVVETPSLESKKPAVRPATAMDPTSAPRFEFARHVPPAPHANPPEPTIQVTIGRIEVRAVSSQAASSKQQGTASPVMSLNDYLHSRRGGA